METKDLVAIMATIIQATADEPQSPAAAVTKARAILREARKQVREFMDQDSRD